MCPDDTRTDDKPSTLRATADLFEQRAKETSDAGQRQALYDYAKIYRDMAELAEGSAAEAAEIM
jgi:hypothetical protein